MLIYYDIYTAEQDVSQTKCSMAKTIKSTTYVRKVVDGGLELKCMIVMTKPWDGKASSSDCGSSQYPLPSHCHLIRTDLKDQITN